MSEPVGQHIVPKCYLKNFAVQKRKDENFVDVLFNHSSDRKIHRQNVKNICKIREFYTFDNLPDEEKRWLETYYSHHIENIYPDIYRTLTDDSIDSVTAEFKLKILVYIIAQELRTPKLAEGLNSISNRTIEYAFLAHQQLGVEKKIYSKGNKDIINLEGKTLSEAQKENENSNRQMANLEAVRRLRHIAELKMDYHIFVTRYDGTAGLISSDRPVHADWPLYNPDGKMSLPIDRNHMVNLYPFDREIDPDPLKILRLEYTETTSPTIVRLYNMHQLEKADRYLYGHKDDIERAIKQYEALRERSAR